MKSFQLVGRTQECAQIHACLSLGKNILIEGPVGAGKTALALWVAHSLKRAVFRIDGDSRYSEQKLSGWFDPPAALERGFNESTFVAGPLVEAMRRGAVLFINELNRLPEGVQNVLLPAIDERMIIVPRLGEIQAAAGFVVIATQNPKEFVATSHLSEAILDRFELIFLDYPSEEEEIQMVMQILGAQSSLPENAELAQLGVRLIRMSRSHPKIRRGASIRAAISVCEITQHLMSQPRAHNRAEPSEESNSKDLRKYLTEAALVAIPSRIELEFEVDSQLNQKNKLSELIHELIHELFSKHSFLKHPEMLAKDSTKKKVLAPSH